VQFLGCVLHALGLCEFKVVLVLCAQRSWDVEDKLVARFGMPGS